MRDLPEEWVLSGRRVVLPGGVREAAIRVRGGEIVSVEQRGGEEDVATVEAGDSVVMPGLVDTHVHVNEPGRTEWEGFETATCAAAAGGVTTLVDMPLNSVPSTTDVEAFRQKRRAADGKCAVDVGFWGGVVPGNSEELAALHRDGVLGFKCFRIDSGVEEFPHVGRSQLDEAMPRLADLGSVLLTHAELPGPVEAARDVWDGAATADYTNYLASRPPQAEVEAIREMVELAETHDCAVHIVHLAAPQALDSLDRAKSAGVPVTVETCPHYLTFDASEVPRGATAYKCAPPVRGKEARDALWEALGAESIDLVATDHSPSPPRLKSLGEGDFREAWGGIASLQVSLPVVWTEARERGFDFGDVARWMAGGPASLAGIDDRKGRIEVGRDADFVLWNPGEQFEVDAEELEHRHPVTPYDGMELAGSVERTFVRGKLVYDDGEFRDEPVGEFVLHRRREGA